MTTMTARMTTGAVQVVTTILLGQRVGDTRDGPLVESKAAEEIRNCVLFLVRPSRVVTGLSRAPYLGLDVLVC